MAEQSLPIPEVDSQPLSDIQGVFGYRLELLYPLGQSELLRHRAEIRAAVCLLHEAGFCRGDMTMSNIMQNRDGVIRIVDFGTAGRLGRPLPS